MPKSKAGTGSFLCLILDARSLPVRVPASKIGKTETLTRNIILANSCLRATVRWRRKNIDTATGIFPVALLAVMLIVALDVFLYRAFFHADRVEVLTTLQEKELDTFLQVNQLLIGLATLIFGAIGTIAINVYKSTGLPQGQWRRAVGCSFLSGLSVCLGYLNYERILSMLHRHTFNLDIPVIRWHSRLQFMLFLSAILLLAAFSYRALRRD